MELRSDGQPPHEAKLILPKALQHKELKASRLVDHKTQDRSHLEEEALDNESKEHPRHQGRNL